MIYLIITTSLIDKINDKNNTRQKHRNATYLNSIRKTLSHLPLEIVPIIVENNGKRETILDSFPCKVHYTDNNKKDFYHKGVNELNDIHEVIDKYNIQDDDFIIKITGRYHVNSSEFFKRVIDNQSSYDAFIKFYNVCTLKFLDNDLVLGLFAIRCNYLKLFSYNDFSKSPEVEFSIFVRNTISTNRILKISNLGLTCCFADNLRILNV
jgi:hypothetical protein